MNTKSRGGVVILAAMIGLGLAVTGCSDKSKMRLIIDSIKSSSVGNVESDFVEADMMGNFGTSHCSAIQDTVKASVHVEAPGSWSVPTLANHNNPANTFGPPSYGMWVTGFKTEYFYYDPNDGSLRGPVSGLGVTTSNMHLYLKPMDTLDKEIFVPAATFNVKAWCARATCQGLPGFPGPGFVSRVICRITLFGNDETGKNISATGDILMYLYDYGPYPVIPSGGSVAAEDLCVYSTLTGYWTGICQ